MIYLYDFIFICGLIILKQLFKFIQDKNLRLFMQIRDIGFWGEYSYILWWLYLSPRHNGNEAIISFTLCMATRALTELILPRKYK